MSALTLGAIIGVVTLLVLFSGAPVAFALGFVSLGVLWLLKGWGAVAFLSEKLFNGLDDFTLVSIPMFVLMGAAVASSRAGADLYEAFARWFNRVPGSLVVSNIGACALFAALTGSSPATCAAIGKMGIPEMQKRGYRDDLATGAIAAGGTLGILIPPSLTMILYGIASETSIGRLFLAGVVPGLLLTLLFIAWSMFLCRLRGDGGYGGVRKRYSLGQHLEMVPRVVPFLIIVVGVVWALYGGYATPSEAASVGALFCLVLVILIYRMWRVHELWHIFRDTTRESIMILMIIGTSILFGYMMSDLRITQAIAEWIGGLQVNRWVLMLWINVFLLVLGCFLPPAAIILMTTPILLPILTKSGFDPIWFGVILTINMELGLITPPVGLNLYVINGIAPHIRLGTI
ncbi:MAG: TRAP transporter large permease, partial [Rhodospirillaceae bacterium]|nr:TRAP transporter large permease [Rhodospirillaceae bacterium]